MRIAVDATPISSRVTGAARVLLNLLEAFPRVDPDNDYVALATTAGASQIDGVTVEECEVGSGLSWERGGVGRAAARVGADLLFTIREVAPRTGPPAVVHVFEPPAYRLHAGLPDRALAKDALLHLGLRGTVRRAAAVTAGSEATATWLRERYDIDPPVVLPGLEPQFREAPASDRGRYFFHLMTGDRRECGDLVLDAFARARIDGVTLKIAGTPAAEHDALRRRTNGLSVEVLGWVDDDELVSLYRHALAFLHPTRYEGYAGNPVLEAMGLGTPVVALRAPGVTEAVEGVGVLLDEPNAERFAEELRRLAGDERYRDKLAARGAERVRYLTWDVSAAGFARVFRTQA